MNGSWRHRWLGYEVEWKSRCPHGSSAWTSAQARPSGEKRHCGESRRRREREKEKGEREKEKGGKWTLRPSCTSSSQFTNLVEMLIEAICFAV